MSRPQIINPSSVQSQFTSLVNDKDKFSSIVASSDRERKVEEMKIQHLRTSHSALTEKIRLASTTLGTQQKKKSMLEKEVSRLNHVLDNDRNELKKLSGDVRRLQQETIAQKFQFVKEMDGLNDELADALRRFEESRLESTLHDMGMHHPEACKIVEGFIAEKIGTSAHMAGQNQWTNLMNSMQCSLERLNKAMATLEEKKTYHTSLSRKCSDLRNKVQHENTEALEGSELDQLERIWEQQESHDADDTSQDKIVHNNESLNRDQNLHKQHPNQERHDPVNMHLFYGDEIAGVDSRADTKSTNDNCNVVQEHENVWVGQ